MADITEHLGIPKPNRARVPSRNIDAEFDALALAWDIVDAFLHALALEVVNKAEDEHDHAMSKITGLVDALNAKMPANRQFSLDDLTDVEGASSAPTNWVLVKSSGGLFVPSTALAALGVHPHLISEVTGLAAALADRPTRAEVAEALNVLSDDLIADMQQRGMPVGTTFMHLFPTPPSGSLALNGQAVTPVYADLRAMIIAMGSPWGTAAGDPKLPDLITNGEFLRAGGPGGLPVGLFQLDAVGPLEVRRSGYPGPSSGVIGLGAGASKSGLTGFGSDTDSDYSQTAAGDPTNVVVRGVRNATETRPRTFVGLPCVKAYGTVDLEGMADLSALLTAIADRPTAEAGADNTKLMTPQNTRWALAAYNNWELIEDVNLSGVGAYSRNGLSAFRELRLEGYLIPSASVVIMLRVSLDNGANWQTTADHYGQYVGVINAASSLGASATYTYVPFSPSDATAGASMLFDVLLSEFNKARRMRGISSTSSINTSGNTSTFHSGIWTAPTTAGQTARDAIQLLPASGTLSGKFTLFGKR